MKEADKALKFLQAGHSNAISRADLSEKLGISDRKARQHIEDLRNDGHLILNLGSGYYIADPEEDIEQINQFYWQERARALSNLKRLKVMRKLLKEKGYKV